MQPIMFETYSRDVPAMQYDGTLESYGQISAFTGRDKLHMRFGTDPAFMTEHGLVNLRSSDWVVEIAENRFVVMSDETRKAVFTPRGPEDFDSEEWKEWSREYCSDFSTVEPTGLYVREKPIPPGGITAAIQAQIAAVGGPDAIEVQDSSGRWIDREEVEARAYQHVLRELKVTDEEVMARLEEALNEPEEQPGLFSPEEIAQVYRDNRVPIMRNVDLPVEPQDIQTTNDIGVEPRVEDAAVRAHRAYLEEFLPETTAYQSGDEAFEEEGVPIVGWDMARPGGDMTAVSITSDHPHWALINSVLMLTGIGEALAKANLTHTAAIAHEQPYEVAVIAMKHGYRVARASWNGRGWLVLGEGQRVAPSGFWNKHTKRFAYDRYMRATNGDTDLTDEHRLITVAAYIILVDEQSGSVNMGFAVDGADQAATDWIILED